MLLSPIACLPVAKSFNSVQDDPFQNSVFAVTGYPPKTREDLLSEPVAPQPCLEVFNSAISVHDVPSHDSVLVARGQPGLSPTAAIADVAEPEQAISEPELFKSPTSVQFVPSQLSVNAL